MTGCNYFYSFKSYKKWLKKKNLILFAVIISFLFSISTHAEMKFME